MWMTLLRLLATGLTVGPLVGLLITIFDENHPYTYEPWEDVFYATLCMEGVFLLGWTVVHLLRWIWQ